MEKEIKKKYLKHLEKVIKEINHIKIDLEKKPDSLGDFENRLYWAIKGIDPCKAICSKHNRKLHKNEYGEFICGDCIDDIVEKARLGESIYDEGLWFDPKDKPEINVQGISYGSN